MLAAFTEIAQHSTGRTLHLGSHLVQLVEEDRRAFVDFVKLLVPGVGLPDNTDATGPQETHDDESIG